MTWQFKSPENGLIDGKTRHEWQELGVAVWVVRKINELPSIYSASTAFGDFAPDHQYAPGTLDGLPAAWPAKMDWQWRRLERDMDERTWLAVPRWAYGGLVEPAIPAQRNGLPREGWESRYGGIAAKAGEFWAPADRDGNPCDWPELAPQPVVVIPAAEMTPLVLYGHLAMGGTWQWQCTAQNGPWVEATANTIGCWRIGKRHGGEQWSPADEHGDFCELRRVVSDTSAEVERRRVDELDRQLQAAKAQAAGWRLLGKRVTCIGFGPLGNGVVTKISEDGLVAHVHHDSGAEGGWEVCGLTPVDNGVAIVSPARVVELKKELDKARSELVRYRNGVIKIGMVMEDLADY